MPDTTHTPANHPPGEPLPFDDRTRRVLELRRQVREGTYRPDPDAIARAILQAWLADHDQHVPDPPAPNGRRRLAATFVVPRSSGEGEAATRSA